MTGTAISRRKRKRLRRAEATARARTNAPTKWDWKNSKLTHADIAAVSRSFKSGAQFDDRHPAEVAITLTAALVDTAGRDDVSDAIAVHALTAVIGIDLHLVREAARASAMLAPPAPAPGLPTITRINDWMPPAPVVDPDFEQWKAARTAANEPKPVPTL